mmetsp:Transcript_121000/g.209421  ORF Transcript_121000/g.209421 Transcript_121000/m.209421 type:complete len:81 (-) Transcript_121000:189-431(-)
MSGMGLSTPSSISPQMYASAQHWCLASALSRLRSTELTPKFAKEGQMLTPAVGEYSRCHAALTNIRFTSRATTKSPIQTK